MNFYNEFDPKAAAWLRELIKAGLIPAGDVDERSITEIKPHELNGYTQCHFFAGIGGWPVALQLAVWPTDRPVWTGSCPCQPFSSAGKGLGEADARHLWPVFFNLIRECRPEFVFGEQVASAIGKGWLDGISADLEQEDYACGAAVLGAHSVGAPHIRQRLYWVADAGRGQCEQRIRPQGDGLQRSADHGSDGRLADGIEPGLEGPTGDGDHGHEPGWVGTDTAGSVAQGGAVGGLAYANGRNEQRGSAQLSQHGHEPEGGSLHGIAGDSERTQNFWSNAVLIPCRDGKARRVEPSIFPLAHGLPGRVGLLRGAGNAIVPQVAAQFISAYLETQCS
jgi:DNA (cytosine-5)-methyltransferase 1